MATFRVKKESGNFVTIHKDFITDERLSAKAKGILLYLLSRPDDWQIYTEEIKKHMKDGAKSINTGIHELIDCGYIKRSKKRQENGVFNGYEYLVYELPTEMPFSENGKSANGKMENRKRHTTNNNSNYNDLTNNNSTYNNNNCRSEISINGNNVFNFYQSNGFGTLSPYLIENINEWINDFKKIGSKESNLIIIEALKIAIQNNKRTWKFTSGVLKNWYNDGIKNVNEIELLNKQRKSNLTRINNNFQKNKDFDNSQYNDLF
ncbi:DNA replication protein DnaD [Staphylococcus hominis]|nr:DNA replication protein DnaD [Staphylococcus hominis]